MSSVVRTATAGSPITRGATAIVPSARGRRHEIGSPRARPTCCRSATSTSPSHCPPRSPTGTRRRYTICCSVRHQRRCSRSRPSKHLGARIGFTAVLHSWGSAMTHHPHLHIIVPGGGISLDGTRWVHCKPGFLLPVRVLSRLFRRLFLAALVDAHATGRLAFLGAIEGLRR